MSLIQLIYVSSAATEYDADELDRILESSVRRNRNDGITGMLLYSRGTFLQVLEGEESSVDKTYARIAEDPRHKDICLIEREPVASRSFSSWHMGFRRITSADSALHPGFAPFFDTGFDAQRIGASKGLALDILKDFARRE